MEYIRELEFHLERIKLSKERHVIGNRWEMAAACRDIEVYLEASLTVAKRKLNQEEEELEGEGED